MTLLTKQQMICGAALLGSPTLCGKEPGHSGPHSWEGSLPSKKRFISAREIRQLADGPNGHPWMRLAADEIERLHQMLQSSMQHAGSVVNERLRAALSDLHGLILKRASYTEMEVCAKSALSSNSSAPEIRKAEHFDIFPETGCDQCPWTVGDTYQRDCAFPDCSPCWTPSATETSVVLSDEALRVWWRAAGGSFHGPTVETGTMPEAKLLPLLRQLVKANPLQPFGDSVRSAQKASAEYGDCPTCQFGTSAGGFRIHRPGCPEISSSPNGRADGA